jgi:hypothetical protein
VLKELQFAMIMGTKYSKASGLPNPIHGCVEVIEDLNDRYIMPIESIEGAVHLIAINEEESSTRQPREYLVNNHIDLDTYYYVY